VALQVGVFAWVALVAARAGWSPGDGSPWGWALDSLPVDLLVRVGALERSRVWGGQWWRLGSAVLLHASWLHLGLNAFFGLDWCRLVERVVGTARFLVLFAVAGLAASAASLLAGDRLSVGSSGALFGMIGATLVLHRRALPGWWPFLRSRPTVLVALQLTGFTVVALLNDLPLDHAAHGGGLVAGAIATWLLTSPRRRAAALAASGAALLALLVAACWPRPGLSRLAADELARRIHAALRQEDQAAAAALLEQADKAGLADDALTYYRGLLAVQQGRLEEAARLLRPVAWGGAPAVRAEARRALAGVARNLGYRSYTGEGAPKDPEAGVLWLDEACAAGDAPSCRDVARIRGKSPP
jgi:rhomboid protease GluP